MLNRNILKNSKPGFPLLIAIIVTGIILLLIDYKLVVRAGNAQENSHEHSETNTIVPGVRVGDYKLGMSKDDVLKSLGKPKTIFHSGERYTLENLPRKYFMLFDDISFGIVDDSVEGIAVLSPLYKFANGLGVGDSEQKIKQTFGADFLLEETEGKDFLTYEDKGLVFEIHKKNRTVMEISITKKISRGHRGSLAKEIKSVNEFDDVSSKDLSKLDLSTRKRLISTLSFNQKTVWPEKAKMPPGSNPKKILTDAINPGLGVRELHQQGITGKGVNVSIIDQPLQMDHPEYSGKFLAYHDTGCGGSKTSMHGPAMTNQLVGNQCGTAPGARVYYVAVPSWKADAAYYADALDWIVTQNKALPVSEKIRVVSVSAQPSGAGSRYINQPMWDQAVQRAEKNDILVLDCTWHHGIVSVCWLDPQDRESIESCTPGFRRGSGQVDKGHIHVPTAPRTVVQCWKKSSGYAYDGGGSRSSRPMSKGGYSDSIPYAAGILAMCWQVRPDIGPEQMRELLFNSAFTHKSGAKIINPKKFILMAKRAKVARRRNRRQRISPVRSKTKDPSTLVRQAAAEGRIAYKHTTPDEFKAIAGHPTREWTEADGENIYMEYPGVEVKFFGKPEMNIPHTILYVKCKDMGIDIGQNRPVVLRDDQPSDRPSREDISSLVRQAAADGRISYKLTTPDEFKAIAGEPTKEWTEGGDVILMEYPGVEVKFFGKPEMNIPHTIVYALCDRRGIDIGQNRLVTLRHEKDLDKFGKFSSYTGMDLSRLDLSRKGNLLKTMSFNSHTVWPESDLLPTDFDPKAVMEWGKNPGLGVRSLHKKGITGRGVAIAVIDQPLLVDHQEYADRLRLYEEIHIRSGTDPQMHGPAVASIALGKTVGVAPEAELYYIAQFNFDWEKGGTPTLKYLAQAIHRIVEINEQLPKDKKIRVISISKGWGPSHKDYRAITRAVRKAKAKGILVLCTSVENIYEGFDFGGLGRSPLANPDIFGAYEPGLFLAGAFKQGRLSPNESRFWVPMDSRTTAGPGGSDEYVFYREGGFSWAVPYIAGVYALAVQVDPDITPERFWTLAVKTGRIIRLNHKGRKRPFGPILNPVKLITALQKTGRNINY